MARSKRVPQTTVEDTTTIYFEPKTTAQQEAFDLYKANDVTFLLGCAGTGKTHIAVYCALYDMFSRIKTRRVDRIILTRPIVEAGEALGFLPGEVDQKVHPYMLPVYDCVGKMVHKPEEFVAENFEIAPLAYMRGRTFENCVAILDEAQNCTNSHLKLFMTRLGNGGKMIITGDPDQSDIGRSSALKSIVDALEGTEGIGVYRFTDKHIVRHPMVSKILAKWPK